MEEIYKGIKITLREYENNWECEIDGRNRIKSNLPEARKRIDDFLDKEKKFERFNVLVKSDWYSTMKLGDKVVVTSEIMTKDHTGKDIREYWIKYNEKRLKENSSNFCADTPENLEIINQIKKLRDNISTLQLKEKELINSLK